MKPGQPFADLPALAATDKKSLSVQTKGKCCVSGDALDDHFRGATKMIVYGKVRPALHVLGIRRFSTQCEENLNEVPA